MTDAYLAAINGGDIREVAVLYAGDVVFTLGNLPFGPEGGSDTYTGKANALNEHQQSIDANARITLSDAGVEGNVLRAKFSYIDDRFDPNIFGGPGTGTWETVVEDGKITRLTMTFDRETYARWSTALVSASTTLSPIVVPDGTSQEVVMGELPGSEVECVRQDLGEEAFEQFSQSDFSEDTSEAEEGALSRCLSNESISRFLLASLSADWAGLATPLSSAWAVS